MTLWTILSLGCAVGGLGLGLASMVSARRARRNHRDQGTGLRDLRTICFNTATRVADMTPYQAVPTPLVVALSEAKRPDCVLARAGYPGETIPDPIAVYVLEEPRDALTAVESELRSHSATRFSPLSGGASSVVLDVGDGRVVRLGLGRLIPKPDIPEMVQPLAKGAVGSIRFEIMPKIDTDNISEVDVEAMKIILRAKGYRFSDPGTDNLGRTSDGRLVVLDPGAISVAPVDQGPVHASEPPGDADLMGALRGRAKIRLRGGCGLGLDAELAD